ncbi:hypothetical protein ACW7EJ_17835, partial [Acinetobacter soli]
KACVTSGLDSPSMHHGLDLRNGYYADQYISKWGIEDEITKGHTTIESCSVSSANSWSVFSSIDTRFLMPLPHSSCLEPFMEIPNSCHNLECFLP